MRRPGAGQPARLTVGARGLCKSGPLGATRPGQPTSAARKPQRPQPWPRMSDKTKQRALCQVNRKLTHTSGRAGGSTSTGTNANTSAAANDRSGAPERQAARTQRQRREQQQQLGPAAEGLCQFQSVACERAPARASGSQPASLSPT